MVDRPPPSRAKPLSGIRVLVVEDHADCRNALRILLQSNGAEVRGAASVGEARVAFARLRPHVLISDLSLPGEDGFSLLASVRALRPEEGSDTPAVAFSALSPVRAQVRAREAGFQVFLRKPGDVLQIVPTVVRMFVEMLMTASAILSRVSLFLICRLNVLPSWASAMAADRTTVASIMVVLNIHSPNLRITIVHVGIESPTNFRRGFA